MHKARQCNKVRMDLWHKHEAAEEDHFITDVHSGRHEAQEESDHESAAQEPSFYHDEHTKSQEAEMNSKSAEALLLVARDHGRKGEYTSTLQILHSIHCGTGASWTHTDCLCSICARTRALSAQALFGLGRYKEAHAHFRACVDVVGDSDSSLDKLRGKCVQGIAECEKKLQGAFFGARLCNPRQRVTVSTSLGKLTMVRNTRCVEPVAFLGIIGQESLSYHHGSRATLNSC